VTCGRAVQLLNFAIMPLHLQIPTAAGISFVWTVILSMMRGAMGKKRQYEHLENIETDEHVCPHRCVLAPYHVCSLFFALLSHPPAVTAYATEGSCVPGLPFFKYLPAVVLCSCVENVLRAPPLHAAQWRSVV
jgi:hypothetical protein